MNGINYISDTRKISIQDKSLSGCFYISIFLSRLQDDSVTGWMAQPQSKGGPPLVGGGVEVTVVRGERTVRGSVCPVCLHSSY